MAIARNITAAIAALAGRPVVGQLFQGTERRIIAAKQL